MLYMPSDNDILDFLQVRLAAHEGGAPAVHIGYDDATFCFVITQRKGFSKDAHSETLGCSRSLTHAFKLAISGKVYDE